MKNEPVDISPGDWIRDKNAGIVGKVVRRATLLKRWPGFVVEYMPNKLTFITADDAEPLGWEKVNERN